MNFLIVRNNAIVNLIGTAYISFLNFIIFPIYLNHLESSIFGIFCFLFSLLIIIKIFDFGASTTLIRYISLIRHQNNWKLQSRQLIRTFELYFIFISVLIIGILFFFSNFILDKWLILNLAKPILINQNVISDKHLTIVVFSFIISLRFFVTLYKGVLFGLEKQIWFNIVRGFSETFQFFGAIIIIVFFDLSLIFLFSFLSLIIFFEVIIYKHKINSKIPFEKKTCIYKSPFYENLNFFTNIGVSSLIWIITGYFDRIIFANVLEIKYYGYFILIVFCSSLSLLIIGPLIEGIIPRLTNLYKQINKKDYEYIFSISILITIILVFSLNLMIIFYSKEILFLWTKNSELMNWANKPFQFYFIGYSFLALSFPGFCYLKIRGELGIHTIGSFFWSVLIILSVLISAYIYKSIYVASVLWMIINFFYFILFSFAIYIKFYNVILLKTIMKNLLTIIPTSLILLIITFFLNNYLLINVNNVSTFIFLTCYFMFINITLCISSNLIRKSLFSYFHNLRNI